MKTAVLLNGNYRTFDRCSPVFLDKFNPLSPDYFINTYDVRYMYHGCIKNALNFYDEQSIDINSFSEFEYKDILIDSYSDMVQYFDTEILPTIHPAMILENGSSYLQLVKWKKGLDMITKYEIANKIKYDLIILTRFDVIPNSIDHLNYFDIINKVIMNKCSMGFANDQILISTKGNLLQIIDFMLSEFHNFTIESSRNTIPHNLMKNAIDRIGIVHEEHSQLLHCILRENNVKALVA
jgi:hypothetical protein